MGAEENRVISGKVFYKLRLMEKSKNTNMNNGF